MLKDIFCPRSSMSMRSTPPPLLLNTSCFVSPGCLSTHHILFVCVTPPFSPYSRVLSSLCSFCTPAGCRVPEAGAPRALQHAAGRDQHVPGRRASGAERGRAAEGAADARQLGGSAGRRLAAGPPARRRLLVGRAVFTSQVGMAGILLLLRAAAASLFALIVFIILFSKLGSRMLGQLFPPFRPVSLDRVITRPLWFAIISSLDLPFLVCVPSSVVHQSTHSGLMMLFDCHVCFARRPLSGARWCRYGAVSRPDLQRRFPELEPVTLKELLSRIAELDTVDRR